MEGIRPAASEDEAQIYRLIAELESAGPDAAAFTRVYQTNLTNPRVLYWVYEQDGRILAFISAHFQTLLHHTGKIAEIQEFIVTDGARGRGIGRELFEKIRDLCQENGCLQLEVCCNLKRLSSHQFYRDRGMASSHYKFYLPL